MILLQLSYPKEWDWKIKPKEINPRFEFKFWL